MYVDPGAWTAELADRPDLAREPLIAGWAAKSWPLVVRRRCERDRPGRLALGLPLPPSHGKARIAVDLPPRAVRSLRPALALAEVRDSAPEAWRPTIDALLDLARSLDVDARVFGSFAWAALTGLDYMTQTSDLDLIWPLSATAGRLLETLAALDATAPGRLDGEIVDAAGGAVQWRELATDAASVLVKTRDGVAMMRKAEFLRHDGVSA